MIHEHLDTGKHNMKSSVELCEILHLNRRDFYRQLRRERRQGFLILSSRETGNSGFWLWDGDSINELKNYYAMQRKSAIDILKTLHPVYETLKKRGDEI